MSMKKLRKLLFGENLMLMRDDFWLWLSSLASRLRRSSRCWIASRRFFLIWLRWANVSWLSARIVTFARSAMAKISWDYDTKSSKKLLRTGDSDSESEAGFSERGWVVEQTGFWLAVLGWVVGVKMLAAAVLVVFDGANIPVKSLSWW